MSLNFSLFASNFFHIFHILHFLHFLRFIALFAHFAGRRLSGQLHELETAFRGPRRRPCLDPERHRVQSSNVGNLFQRLQFSFGNVVSLSSYLEMTSTI